MSKIRNIKTSGNCTHGYVGPVGGRGGSRKSPKNFTGASPPKCSVLALIFSALLCFALFTQCEAEPKTIIEYIDREVPIKPALNVPCLDEDCIEKTKLSRVKMLEHSQYICEDEECLHPTAHVATAETLYDANIWSSWYGRNNSAFHETLETAQDPAYTTTYDGNEVYPCISDADRQKAETVTTRFLDSLHPDPECDLVGDCSRNIRKKYYSAAGLGAESGKRCSAAACSNGQIGSHATQVWRAFIGGLTESWYERGGDKYHDYDPEGLDPEKEGVVLVNIGEDRVFPCFNNADIRYATPRAQQKMDEIHPPK
ncbi:MAG: hypothetical protein FWG99_01645 [Treponema sp.]|nr:hypothetical protein [Treponema sp.]